MKQKTYSTRKWLNPKDNQARAYVMGGGNTHNSGVELSVAVADCNRQITLDFSLYFPTYDPSMKAFKNLGKEYLARKEKFDILRKELDKAESFMDEWYRDFELVGYAEAVANHKDNKTESRSRLGRILDLEERLDILEGIANNTENETE